jgi:hypothetical protein
VLQLAGLWICAFVLCVVVEWTMGRRTSATEVIWAGLFLPLTAVVGGRAAFGTSSLASAVIGLAYWPVWVVMARHWLTKGPTVWMGAALEVWMLVGFAQPVARFGLVMSA